MGETQRSGTETMISEHKAQTAEKAKAIEREKKTKLERRLIVGWFAGLHKGSLNFEMTDRGCVES